MSRLSKIQKQIAEYQKKLRAAREERTAEILKVFSAKVRFYRKKAGMTQGELAELVGMSRASIANVELRNAGVSLGFLVALCEVFDVTPNDLLGHNKTE